MSNSLLVETTLSVGSFALTPEAQALALINEESVIGLDALIALMPQYSWSQIFQAIDRLARSGKIVLRRHRFDYTLFSAHYAA